MLDVAQAFSKALLDADIKRFEVISARFATFAFLGVTFKTMHETVKKMLEGKLNDVSESTDPVTEPDHVKNIKMMNWSFALHKITKSGISDDSETLSDLDSMALNISLAYDTH